MIITAIEDFAKGQGRVAIYLDGQFAFVLYKGELSKYTLSVGCEVDDKLYTCILEEVIIPRAKKRGMNLLMKMDRTEKDVRNKLEDGGYPIAAVDSAIDYLKSFHYIDDNRYACDYIHYKSKSMSRKQIKYKLIEKGIEQSVIEAAFMDYSDDNEEEFELVKKLMIKKMGNKIGSLDYNEKQKLFSYLYNKGFSMSDIDRAYNCLT